jgi:hypothetical protein
MIQASCHCGAVRLEIESAPEEVLDCACSICRRKGALWAYYSPRQVRVIPPSGTTAIYTWGDRNIEFHSCKVCACSTHWSPVDKALDRMGVNARMMASNIVAAARVRKSAGA